MKKQIIVIILILISIMLSCDSQREMPRNVNLYDNLMTDVSFVKYLGGDGSTKENAIVIQNAKNEYNGVSAEMQYISRKNGERNKAWSKVSQTLLTDRDKYYDLIEIVIIKSGEKKSYYFDITEFYGRF